MNSWQHSVNRQFERFTQKRLCLKRWMLNKLAQKHSKLSQSKMDKHHHSYKVLLNFIDLPSTPSEYFWDHKTWDATTTERNDQMERASKIQKCKFTSFDRNIYDVKVKARTECYKTIWYICIERTIAKHDNVLILAVRNAHTHIYDFARCTLSKRAKW